MANFVQFYSSYDQGCPSLSGTAGALITVLNKVLVDGYTTASVTSISRSGTTATVTLAAANTTLITGNYVTISGAAQTDYNGTFQITLLTSTTFTYTVGGSPVTPATGTILYAKAGLGWTRPFAAGTNSQTYRSADTSSNQFYLQVIDNAATTGAGREAQIYGAEAMSGDQAVTLNRFPTIAQAASGLCWAKSGTADATVTRWAIIGDDKTFYFFNFSNYITASYASDERMNGFGHLISYKPGDAYNTFVGGDSGMIGTTSSSATQNPFGYCMGYGYNGIIRGGLFVARAYTQTAGAVNVNTFGSGYSGAPGGPNGVFISYPNMVDTGAYTVPLTMWETGVQLRGRFPGIYAPLFNAHNYFNAFDRLVLNNPTSVTTVAMPCSTEYSSGQTYGYGKVFVDIFGPWV